MLLLRKQELDNGVACVLPPGAADLMELRVKQLLQPIRAASDPRVMQLDFQGFEEMQKLAHFWLL